VPRWAERERELLLQALDLGAGRERELAGLDLATEAGQEAFRKALQEIFEIGASAEGFDPTQLVGASAEEILAILGSSADALNALGEAAEEASQQMLNVPTAFEGTVARIRHEAQRAIFPLELGDVLPGPVGPLAGQTFADLANAVKKAKGLVHNGDNVINIDGHGKDTQQLAREIVRELRIMSQAKFGTTDRWGEV
jgi:hypothetical protein